VVYDDQFTTVGSDITRDNIPVPEGFDELLKYSREYLLDPEDLETEKTHVEKILDTGDANKIDKTRKVKRISFGPEEVREEIKIDEENEPSAKPSGDLKIEHPPAKPADNATNTNVNDNTMGNSRYPVRERKPVVRYSEEYAKTVLIPSDVEFHDLFLFESNLNRGHSAMTAQFDVFDIIKSEDNDEDVIEALHPFAFAARANAEDTPYFHEAMNGPDAAGFKQAMEDEINLLEEMDSWTIVPREKAIREGKKVLDSVWSFKRKRFPDGFIKKLKARFCIHGGQQEKGIDFDDTFSPVVAWSTVRMMLILSIVMELKTKQVDFTLAFVQAKLDPGTFIEMPRLFEQEGMVLELKRNLYGGKDAGANFFFLLKEQLEKRGFRSSDTDACLFINDETGCIMLVYVDDCILFHKDEKVIDTMIADLEKPRNKDLHKFLIKVEDDYAGFLGIDIRRNEDGTIELLQTGLIDRILAALNMIDADVTIRQEPAAKEPLGKDVEGPQRKESWSYPSLIGMMLYLSSNSRPDIAYAVHSCCRFNHCAKQSHEKGIKRIARYLKGTRTRGLIFDPKKELKLEMFCDADFAGLWTVENSDDPVCVKSRTGIILTLGGIPIQWSSKLQSEIATSTMHAEYVALSQGMRELIPVKRQVDELCGVLHVIRDEETKLVKVHEDNEGAMNLANSPLSKVTPHSKHFAVKYHWFREKLDDLKIKVVAVRSNYQKADIFTKGLQGVEFKLKRKLIMGW
jgi:hypothetical protein